MPHIRIVYDIRGWAYHNRALALRKHAPPAFDVSLGACPLGEPVSSALGDQAPDLVFWLPQSRITAARACLIQRGWPSKLVASCNAGWPMRIREFYDAYDQSDFLVFNNKRYADGTGNPPGTTILTNGVDFEVFNVRIPIEARSPKVVWMGSSRYAHVKGLDLMLSVTAELEELGIEVDILATNPYGEKRTPDQMADWYNSGTVFVCTSKTEGTPNTALEAAACGCTVVTTPVGNMPELINDGRNGLVVPRERAAIVAGVTNALEKYAALARQMQIDIQPWSWERRGAAFFDLFRDVLETADRPARRRRPQPLSDLSDKLTIFVTTVGAPSYQECRRHLDRQDCIFKLCIIDRVAPMNVAFQRMLDDCTTPYYVQVDEDMLLRPYAARWLHDRMAEADPDVAIVLAYLFDTHLEMPIQGVKIFRHDIVRDFPFAAVSSCEKEHNSRLRENGYRLRIFEPDEVADSVDGTLGLHGTHWTPDTIFERYANLERKYRRVPQDLPWVAETPALFLRRFVDEGSELDLFALMGIIAGKLASIDGDGEEKDYRDYPNLPGLEYARKFFDEFARERTDGPAALGEFRA